MTGNWPDEWDDPEDGSLDDVHGLAPGGSDARLAEVSAWLAAAADPVLPPGVEARISAAITAEAAIAASGGRSQPLRSRVLGRAPARARVRRPRFRVVLTTGTLVACLLFAGLGFALSRGTSPAGSASSGSEAAPALGEASPAASAAATAAGSAPVRNGAAERNSADDSFAVTATGTRYARSTLTGQVLAQEAAKVPGRTTSVAPGGASVPAASASGTSAAVTEALRGCVLQLTGGTIPRLVDRASYDGTPAYVIATMSHVWVVRLGCTEVRPELITSVSLAG